MNRARRMPSLPINHEAWREIRATVLLALPLVIGQLSSIGMNLIDTALAGHHSSATLAAVGVGSPVWSLALLLIIGVLMAVPPSVSQLNGAGERERIGPLFRQALWLGAALGIGLLLALHFSEYLLRAIGIADDVRPEALRFLHAIAWGAPALSLYFCCRYLSEGVGWTLPTMLVGIGGLFLLLPLGTLLLYGGYGIPALGAAGLGYATAAVLWLQLFSYLLVLRHGRRFADLGLFERFDWPDGREIWELLRIGVPMGVAIFMEGGLFVATALVIGTMGQTAIAAHQVAILASSVTFMVPLGVAMATTVRVGFAAGRQDAAGVQWAGRVGYGITLVTQTVAALGLFFGAGFIAAGMTDDAAVAVMAAGLMIYAAAFQFSDGFQALSAGALRGLKDTRVPMFYTAFAYWGVGMPMGWWMGKVQGQGPAGMWWGLIVGLSVAALLLTARFSRLSARGVRLAAAAAG